MTHNHHEELPGYSANQLLKDSCDECEYRGKHIDIAILSLDIEHFEYAWKRAAELGRNGLKDGSYAELPMLKTLWAVQVQFERIGWPIGDFEALKERARLVIIDDMTYHRGTL